MKKVFTNPILIFLLRLLIGGLFLYACVEKILAPEKFAIAIDNYHFLPTTLVNIWAITLPWIELAIGLFLILGIFVEASSLISAFLFLSFIIALCYALARGLDIGCGCFDLNDEKTSISRLYLLRDFSLMLGSVWIMLSYRSKIAIESLWQNNKSKD